MKKILFVSLILLIKIAFAQVNSQVVYALLKSGDNDFQAKRYITAVKYYKELLDIQPSNLKAQYQLAECYRLMQDYESAEYYYEKVRTVQEIKYPLCGFYYALMQKLKGRYDQSLQNFKAFSNFLVANDLHEKDDYRYYHKQAKIEIDGCQLALNQITMVHPDYQFNPLSAPLNSEFNDYAAFTVWDDDIICLTSTRSSGKRSVLDKQFGESYADVFRFSRSESGGWNEMSQSDRFEKAINTKYGDGSGAFNKERTKFYYTNCDENLGGVCHIYMSRLSGGKWTDPVALNQNINKVSFYSKHPSLTPSGDTLFFASNRRDGLGQSDIWMSLNAGGDNWGPAIHLGDLINTPFNEISPFYDQKDQVLFFASNGHRGFGGFDIYIARGTNFSSSEIYNAGIPFNSYKDDIFFFLGSKKGYLSSNREEGPGKFDIYGFNIESRGNVIAEVSKEETIAGRTSLFTDDYNFDSSESEIINQIISRMLSSSVSEIELILTDIQLEVYNMLSLDDKERIDRIVKTRIRKMTDNMITSIRTEDDHYYQQLNADKRRKVDNIVSAYLEQQGMGNSVSLSRDVFQFYNDADTEEREKIDVLVSDGLANAQQFQPPTPTYNSFSEKEQKSLDGIALKYLKQKQNLEGINLDLNEKVFMRDNLENEEDVNNAIRERLIGLSNEEKFQLVKEDRDFYGTLTKKEKENLKSIATTFMVSDLNSFGQNVDQTQLEVFKNKSTSQKNSLDKLLLKQITNLANSSAYLAEATFTQNELQSALSENADETISNLLKIRPNLSKDQVMALQRFVNTTYDSYISESKSVFLNVSPPVVTVGSSASTGDATARLSASDLGAYEALSEAKKRTIDNIIGLDYLTETYYNRAKRLRDEAEMRRLAKSEKVHIAILAKKVTGQEIKNHEKRFLSAAFAHYNNLSEARKAFYNRIVLDRAFETDNGKFILSPADVQTKKQLSSRDLSLLERIKKFRYNNERVLTENLAVEAKDVDEEPVDIIAIVAEVEEANEPEQLINTQDIMATEEEGEIRISLPIDKIEGYHEITITGQLVNENTDTPLSNHAIKLIAFDNEATVVEGYTNNDGFFDFTVNPKKYDITFLKSGGSESVALSAFNVEGKRLRDEHISMSSTQAFFDVNSFQLRPEVKILLDELVTAFKNSGKKIEIESHTDATGSIEYNLKLSKDRGYSTRDYLISKGIKPSSISVIWHGQGNPIADNDNPFGRQLNRRIDVRLVGRSKKNFGNFYLVKPAANINSLAQSFGLDVQSIRTINGLSGDVEAYQPIRLKAGNLKPDYNLVVPADILPEADFIYLVKPDDTINKVAQRFNVSEEILMKKNNLDSKQLKPGMRLVIFKED